MVTFVDPQKCSYFYLFMTIPIPLYWEKIEKNYPPIEKMKQYRVSEQMLWLFKHTKAKMNSYLPNMWKALSIRLS